MEKVTHTYTGRSRDTGHPWRGNKRHRVREKEEGEGAGAGTGAEAGTGEACTN